MRFAVMSTCFLSMDDAQQECKTPTQTARRTGTLIIAFQAMCARKCHAVLLEKLHQVPG
jgi:hypothetical protein